MEFESNYLLVKTRLTFSSSFPPTWARRLSFSIFVSILLLTILSVHFTTLGQSNAQLEKIATLIADNQLGEAETEIQAILHSKPNDPVVLNLFGTIRAKQTRFAEAESLFTRAIRADDQFVGPHLNLAYLYTLTGKPDKTIVELREVLRLEPKHAGALDQLARLLLAQGRIVEGIQVLEEGEKFQQLTPSLLVLRGDAYLKSGNAAKGEENYKTALARDDQNTDAVLGLAQAAQLKADNNSAAALLARARKMEAATPDTLYRFAVVAMRAGLYEEANRSLLAAINIKSDDASYYLALGTTWIKKPDLDEAEKAFRRTLQLRPGDPQAQMYLGYILLEEKKYPEAIDWLQKSLEQDNSIPETYFYLGQIAQEQNDDQRAIELFKKAIQLAPTYSFAYAGLGASYLRLKNYTLAQQELEYSIKLDPNDAKAHYNLAVLFARLNNQQRSEAEMAIVERLKKAAKPEKSETIQPRPNSPR